MKKTITKSYEALVCDICGREEDLSIRQYIRTCPVCKKDMCSFCEVFIGFLVEKNGHSTHFEKYLCSEHLSELIKLLKS